MFQAPQPEHAFLSAVLCTPWHSTEFKLNRLASGLLGSLVFARRLARKCNFDLFLAKAKGVLEKRETRRRC
eukprot:4289575-Pleurochrysis_carterae.AAC.1